MADDAWIADGSATNVFKKRYGVIPGTPDVVQVTFGVDLSLGAQPRAIREIEVGPDNTAAGNVARNRAIRHRDRLVMKGGGSNVSAANPAGLGTTHARDPVSE